MSTSRKSKKDIDRYVRQIDEKERNGRGYQIALLYYEVGEYDLAKRYLAGYISLREAVPQGHKLMGQIYEASREWEQAASCYKRSLELDCKQKELVLKVCELYNKIPDMNIERLKYWSERAEKHYPNNKVVFGIKEKILTSGNGGSVEEMEEFYGAQLVKNFDNVSLHIKLLDLYINADKVDEAYNHVLQVENSLAFVNNAEWNEFLPTIFHAYQKKENCSNNWTFHRSKLFVLCNLLKLQLQDKDIPTCASTLHQFDQALFEAYQISSKKPKWTSMISEMQGQYFFFMAVLILKRAQKGQQSWKDASSFSGICFLLSNNFPALETKSTWFVQLKQEDSKFYDKLQKIGCYRLSQGGHMLSAITQNDGPAKIQHLKQNLRTVAVRDKLYEVLFTHRDMREKKDRSYLTKTDVYCKTPLVPPSQSAVQEWDSVVHYDCVQNLHEHVWIALNRYSLKDKTQPDYGMNMFDRFLYKGENLENGSPENLDALDVQGFFYATVRCAALNYEEQRKISRGDLYKLNLLPACLTPQLVTKQQLEWWEAVCKFHGGTARENYAKLRVVLQRGIETMRLLGCHGMSVTMIVHLAQTFNERLKEVEKWVEEGQQGLEVMIKSLQGRALHYWKEGLSLLTKMQKNMPIRMPKERMFSDTENTDFDSNQTQYLIDQAKFAIATITMKKGQFEEAKEQFEKLNQPLSAYNLSQIYRKMSDNVNGSDPDAISQKTALLESALDALYISHDRLKGDKNDELNRIIPADIDDVVNQIERLQTSGSAIVDSILQTENDESSDEAASFSTPKGPGQRSYTESPSFIQQYEKEHSTPAVKGKSPGVSLNFSEVIRQRPRPSPERIEAKIWALELKQQTIMDLLRDIKDRSNEMNQMIRQVRDEQETYKEIAKQMREFMAQHPPTGQGQFMNPQFGFPPYGYPPQPPPPQQPIHQSPWMQPPANFGYSMPQRPSFGIPNRFPVPSHQNDIVEDDIYHVDGEYYEDDGSQPISAILNTPDSHLEQNWPFGHRTGLEGKATVAYSPQGRPIPQPGFFAQALRGQALQYAYQQPGAQSSLQKPGQPRNPLNIQQPPVNNGIGPGFFAQQPPLPMASQMPGGTRGSEMYQTGVSSSQPSALIAALQGSSATTTTVSMAPNAVATSSLIEKPNLIQGSSSVTGQQGQGQSVFGTPSDSSMQLFGSLVAAAKSPDTSSFTAPSHLSSFGGLKPTASPAGGSSIPPFASLASQGTSTIPFQKQEGFTGFQDANRNLFIKGNSPGKSPTKSPSKYGGDDDHHEEYEPNVEFKPVIDLPDLVDVKTGEEEEEKLFGHRGKLFRYDPDTKQWKERGVGEMKILRHKESKQVRILMRREQVLKLCANHYLSKDMKLAPIPSSDKAWCWLAMDYSEEELKTEKLCIRFKTEEIASQFKEVFEKCQAELDDMSGMTPNPPTPKMTPTDQPAINDLFKPKIGSWSCNTCLLTNDSTTVKCPACGETKPGADKARSVDQRATPSTKPSLHEMFKPKAGAWSCNTCCVSNKADILKCACCGTLKPGVNPENVKEDVSNTTSTAFKFGDSSGSSGFKIAGGNSSGSSSFKFGDGNSSGSSGFKFGTGEQTGTGMNTGGFKFGETTIKPADNSSGFTFGQKPDTTQPAVTTRTESSGFRFGEKTQPVTAFGDTGGFKFDNQSASASTDVTKPAGEEKEKTITFTKPKAVPVKTPTTGTKSGANTGISFLPPSDSDKTGFTFGPKTGEVKFGQTSNIEGFNLGKKDEKPKTEKEEGAVFSFKITDTHSDDETKEPEVRTGTFVFNPSKDIASGSKDQSPFTVTSSKVENKGDTSPFKFTFTVKPTPDSAKLLKSPKSPEVDPDGMYVNKEGEDDHIYFEPLVKLDRVEVVTGEEDEEVLYEHRAKLYRFVNGEWKERGLGDIRILENKESKQIRLLMRREKILKVCCNHYITSDIEMKPMPKTDGKAWVWYAMDCSEGDPQYEQFSIRFKTADIANEFKAAIDSAKEKISSESSITDTPKQSDQLEKTSPSAAAAARKLFNEDLSDVVIIKEEKATKEQIEKARKFKLPDHFYLYESKPPCPGCIGCEDDDGNPKFKSPPKEKIKQATTSSEGSLFGGVATNTKDPSSAPESSVFGGSATTPGGSIFGSVSGKQDDKTKSGLFGEGLFGKENGGSSESKSAESGGIFGSGTPSLASFGSLATESGDGGASNLFGSGSTGSVFGKSSTGSQFSFASLAAHSGDSPTAFAKDDNKPFKWAGAGQTLFKSAGGETGDGDDDNDDGDGDVEQSHDPHFEPIVPLPDLVEVKTGEEDEEPVFCNRAKLFRFDKDVKQWKEKGIGEMKILKCKFTGRYRLLLRREQVYKLACNHLLTPELVFKPLPTSETSYCWVAEDFAENEAKVEQFAVKFKTIDLGRQFIEKIEECQEELRNMPPPSEDRTPIQCSDDEKEKTNISSSATGTINKQPDISEADDKEDEKSDDEDDDDDEYETEEEEEIIFEKRVSFSSREKGDDEWMSQVLGVLKVLYDEDVNGNRVTMVTDKDEKICSHLIAKESTISVSAKQRNCEWSAIDFSTDEPIRRDFRAQFSSNAALEEFHKTFEQGRSLAVDSDISERDMLMTTQEMSVPQVHSHTADPNK